MLGKAIDAALEWFGRHDYYRHYRTAREAAATRGTIMVGTLAWTGLAIVGFISVLWRGGTAGQAIVAVVEPFGQALAVGVIGGGLIALRLPRYAPYGDWGLITACRGRRLPASAVEAVGQAWAREDAWIPLDARLSLTRPRTSYLGLMPGGSALESVVAAEHDQATGTAFAGTDWRSPGSPSNCVWFAPDTDPSLLPRGDAAGFLRYFSDEAVEARWDALPAEARERAASMKDTLIGNALAFARERRASIQALGPAAANLPLFVAHDVSPDHPAGFAACLVLHEAGHVRLASWHGDAAAYALASRQWGSPLARALVEAQPVPLSLYALFTPAEHFAEHYAAWRSGHPGVTDEMGRLLAAFAHAETVDGVPRP